MATKRPTALEETRPTGHGRARGLVSGRVSGSRLDARTFAPPRELQDFVATFWSGRWDLRGQPPHETRLLGDPCVHVVFEAEGPWPGHEAHRDPTSVEGRPPLVDSALDTSARLVGVWTRLWTRRLDGLGWVRGVKLRAGAVQAVVARDAHELSNHIVPLVSAFDAATVEVLRREILIPEDDVEAFRVFATWLSAIRRPDPTGERALAVALVERITRDLELTTVDRLAEVAGLGPRALQRLFRAHVGASPKSIIRRNRLQEAALRLERGDVLSLATLAAELGYADQAHLARDFKAVVGKSPSAFVTDVHR